MPYVATAASIEILKQMATQLDAAGAPVLLKVINGDATPPAGMTQAAWDAMRAGFQLAFSHAAIDGWLKPAAVAQAASAQQVDGSAALADDWVTAASWSPTPYCPRDLLVAASITGWISVAAGAVQLRLRYNGTVIAGPVQFYMSALTNRYAMPALQGVAPAALTPTPLAPMLIEYQVKIDAGTQIFNWSTFDVASFSLS